MNKIQAKKFRDLLLLYSQETSAAGKKVIEDGLWKSFGIEQSIFVLDMAGFSLLTRKHGIIHYLSMVRRMQMTAEPIIESFGGSVIKFEADNCFATFPDTLPAINAAIAMQLAFEASNLLTSDEFDVHISCGIDYGKMLIIGNEDCFGDAVNRACKLGEDVALAGEIIVTKEAMERIPLKAGLKHQDVTISVSGITIPAFTVQYRA